MGRKNTDRKNARMNRSRCTSSASPRDSAQVSGTMSAANTVNVTSEPVKLEFFSMLV